MIYSPNILADVYGGGNYDSAAYGSGSSTGTSTTTSSGGTLSNTGFDILLIASIACAIIFVALVVRFWKRPKVAKTD